MTKSCHGQVFVVCVCLCLCLCLSVPCVCVCLCVCMRARVYVCEKEIVTGCLSSCSFLTHLHSHPVRYTPTREKESHLLHVIFQFPYTCIFYIWTKFAVNWQCSLRILKLTRQGPETRAVLCVCEYQSPLYLHQTINNARRRHASLTPCELSE